MTRQQTWVLVATILGSGMVFADGSIVTIAIPQMRTALDASLGEMQWVSNSYTLSLSSLLLLGGAAGDRYGLRRIFAVGILVFALASGLCALATSVEMLIATRAMQGLGGAMLAPGSLALLGSHFPIAERGRAIGVWAAATSIAAACGPLVGGWLIDHASWPFIFLINLPLAALALAVLFGGLRDLPRNSSAKMDWIGGFLAFGALGALTAGLTELGQTGVARYPAFVGCALGVVLLAVFLAHEARTAAPMLPLRILLSRRAGGVNGLTFLLYFALSGAVFFLPAALIQARAWSAEQAGSSFLAFTLVLAVCSRFGGNLTERTGLRLPLTLGPLVSALAFALLGPSVDSGDFWRAVVPCMALLGLGMGIAVAPLSAAVMNVAPSGQTGVASAVNNAVARVAGLLAVACLGGVADYGFAASLKASGLSAVILRPLTEGGFGAAPVQATEVVRDAFAAATVRGFTVLTFICAAFAASAALTAWISLREPEPTDQLPR